MKHKVSIIVPAYNCEKYIADCIESLMNQTYIYLEIIIIDDGSTDKTGSICDNYAKDDKRIKVIHKSNGGVSETRNLGIENATGNYLMFVDADDWLDEDIVGKLVADYKAGCLNIFGMRKFINGHSDSVEKMSIPHNLSNSEIISQIIWRTEKDYNLGRLIRAASGKLFDTQILKLNNITFPTDIYLGEDAVFVLKYMNFVDGVNLLAESGYNYRIIETSTCQRYKKDIFYQAERQVEYISEIADNMGLQKNKSVKVSLIELKWSLFFQIWGNSMMAVKKSWLSLLNLFQEPIKWLKTFGKSMYSDKIDSDDVSEKYRYAYEKNKNKTPLCVCISIFINKAFKKILSRKRGDI